MGWERASLGRRGARLARSDEGAYWVSHATEERESQTGQIGVPDGRFILISHLTMAFDWITPTPRNPHTMGLFQKVAQCRFFTYNCF